MTRRITRTEYDGRITVLADRFDGKRLNSPNDIVCQRNGAIWFTDPSFGIMGHWEGDPAEPELPHAVYRLDPSSGELQQVITGLAAPNGLAFSPDESMLYVVESRAEPHRLIWAWDVASDGSAVEQAAADRCRRRRAPSTASRSTCRAICGAAWAAPVHPAPSASALDGVRVYDPAGQVLGHIHLPERCANLCFGGAKNNRLFMASSHSLYALFVNVQGAV